MYLKKLKEERRSLSKKLEEEIFSFNSYKEKFVFIYKIIRKSQSKFAEYIGVNVFNDDNFERLKNESQKIKNDIAFYEFIRENLIKPLGFGHLGIRFENNYINKFISILRYNELCVTDFYEKIEELSLITDLNDEKFKNFINSLNLILPKKTKFKENLTTYFVEDTVIIKIRSFSSVYLKEDSQKFKKLEKVLEENDYKNIIIDIRDNDGGTDDYFKLFSIISNVDVKHKLKWFNLFNEKEEKNSFNAIFKGTDKVYNRFLLVNNRCFSGADSFARLCKENGFAKIVGEKTRGEGYGLTPIILNINLKIPLMLRITVEAPVNDIGKIDYDNEYSVTPDIICLSDEALDTALDIIKENEVKNNSYKI